MHSKTHEDGQKSLVSERQHVVMCWKAKEDEDRRQLIWSSGMKFLSNSHEGSICGVCCIEDRLVKILEADMDKIERQLNFWKKIKKWYR